MLVDREFKRNHRTTSETTSRYISRIYRTSARRPSMHDTTSCDGSNGNAFVSDDAAPAQKPFNAVGDRCNTMRSSIRNVQLLRNTSSATEQSRLASLTWVWRIRSVTLNYVPFDLSNKSIFSWIVNNHASHDYRVAKLLLLLPTWFQCYNYT